MSPTTNHPLAGLHNLVEILRWRAQHQAHRTAYTFLADGEREEGWLTYSQLDRKARAIGAMLTEMDAAGERILLLYPAGLDYVAAFFGCLYAGAVAVPAYPPRRNRPMPRIRAIVADAEAKVALTSSAVFATMEKRIADLPDLQALAWRSTDEEGDERAGLWQAPGLTADSLAFLQYTSGSTAAPKGVMVSHGNLMHNESLIREVCGHGPDTPCVSWLPLYHDLGLIGNMLQSLYVGTPCTLMSPVAFLQRPLRWLRAIDKYGAHTSGGPNFAYELCLSKITPEERATLDLATWKVAFNGAEPVRHSTLERFSREFASQGFERRALLPCYGLAETTLIVSGGPREESFVSRAFDAEELGRNRLREIPAAEEGEEGEEGEEAGSRRLVGSGRVLSDMRVAIVDPETRRAQDEDRVGEIWVAGPSVARGYWGRAEQTEETFAAFTQEGEGPFLRTGDLGFLSRGELTITGRLKDLIIIRGSNHYPQDIELTAEGAHAALRPGCSAAFSIEQGGQERLILVQEVGRTARQSDLDEIVTAVRRAVVEEHELRLAGLVLLKPGAIPKTTSGKIQRRQTRELYLGGGLAMVGQWHEWAEGAAAGTAEEVSGTAAQEVSGTSPGTSPQEVSGTSGRRPQEVSGTAQEVPGTSLEEVSGTSLEEVPGTSGKRLQEVSGTSGGRPDGVPGSRSQEEIVAFLVPRAASVVGLAAQQVDPARSLIDYGLDSLRAIELMHAVQEATGVSLDLERLFDGPSIEDLAREVSAQQARGEARPHPLADLPAPEGDHPLSHGQRALWFLHQLDPRSAAYNMASAVRVRSNLDVGALARAVEELVERHPALRTTFVSHQGEPVQWVHPHWKLDFSHRDASSRGDRDLLAEVLTESRRPFDLATGPLLRVRVWTRVGADHVLLLCLHHIISDFWSMAVLLRELAVLYTAELTGGRAVLPEAVATYPAFIRWQRGMLAGSDGERLAEYWKGALRGDLPVLELPTDRPRPPVQTSNGKVISFRLGAELSRELKGLAHARRATLFVTLLAGFQALLARYSGQRDLLVGSPAAGRRHARLSKLVGYFVNPLVLRGDLRDDPAFEELVSRLRRVVVGAFEHQDYPFPLLVSELQPERDASRSPLFQVMFALQAAPTRADEALIPFAMNEAGASVQVGGLVLEHMELPQGLAQFDLTLSMGEVGSGGRREMVGHMDYNTDLFDAVTIERMAKNLRVLLASAVAAPERRASALPAIAAAERDEILLGWNRTAAEYPRTRLVQEMVEVRAMDAPDSVVVVCEDEALSQGELDRRANRLAWVLLRSGVAPEELVALAAERSVDLITGSMAILRAGAAYVPLDLSAPAERLAEILREAGVRRVVTSPPAPAASGSGGSDGGGAPGLAPALAGGELESFSLQLAHQRGPLAESSRVESPPVRAFARSAACLIYTSGSTGTPKGVILEHQALVNLITSFHKSYNAGPGDAILPMTSVAFSSFVGEIWPLLAVGGKVVLPTREELLDPARTIDLIARQGISILSAVPSVIASLNDLADSLPRLRLLLSGGDTLAAGDIDHLLDTATVVNGYGLTETGICSTIYPLSREDFLTTRAIPIGKPVMNHRLYVMSPSLEMAPIGASGELCVAGEGLARGFHGQPAATAERFVPDPFAVGERMYRTGDLASYRADGQLIFRGRRDSQIKIRGYRIELGEIESVLGRHPLIREAVVTVRDADGSLATGRAAGTADRRLAAHVAFRAGSSLAPAEIAEWARQRLPQYMVPGSYTAVEALPYTLNGKVDLTRLPAPQWGSTGTGVGAGLGADGEPVEGVEGSIAAIWREILGLPQVGIDDNFFDLGGHSLLLARVHARLRQDLAAATESLSLVDLFRFPTVRSLGHHLSARDDAATAEPGTLAAPAAATRAQGEPGVAREIAIIALSGRFPGADSPEGLWANLVAGVETITRFTDEEVLAAGADPDLVADPNYIKAKGILGGVDRFDAAFFGMSPRGAELTDPQHRVFLEVAWEAMERAGHDPGRFAGRVGVFAGQSMNTYWLNNLYHHIDLVASVDSLAAAIGNDKDSLTTEVSYRMNLTGPSVLVQSSSSTSLTAIHYACQSLLAGECEMALAGGVSVHVPEVSGYLYQEGGTTDPEGHCRTFSQDAKGFVSGHGAGVVILRPLADALADGDPVVAVIKGSACNNDGSLKVSYMAPSVDGHARVVAAAQEAAGVSPETVTLIEAHGTGTLLGDPIEVAALTQAFRRGTEEKGFCALTSVKTNIGHLDTAAGVAGLVKAAMCLQHKEIPPILHFAGPNPKIDFAASPFFVNTELRPWTVPEGLPRRAGVSSLGMGGTNTHVVLEEAPVRGASSLSRPWQLVRLSAKSATALEQATDRLVAHLEAEPATPLADVAYTLDVGRRSFEHRRTVVAVTSEEVVELLRGRDPERVLSSNTVSAGTTSSAVFLFSGQGAQYVGMGRELYEHEPFFRAQVDDAAELLRPHLGLDLRRVLYPAVGDEEEAARKLAGTDLTQPALFVVEHALARLWMAWGVVPRAMLGHSIGEYVAACLAGVFSLPDALTLVAERGRLMASLPPGSMLAVPLGEADALRRLEAFAGVLEVAAVNRPGMSVVSGPAEAIESLRAGLAAEGLDPRALHTSHAFHSPMMDPILATFTRVVADVERKPPQIPYVSNVTGTWIRPEEATDPTYYARHLRGTVRFTAGLETLLAGADRAVLEVGPGNALATNLRQHPSLTARREQGKAPLVLTSLPHARDRHTAQSFLLTALGRLWMGGVSVSSEGFWATERRHRVPLPTYPFERQRYWVEPGVAEGAGRKRATARPEDWLWQPVWKQARWPGLAAWGSAGPRAEEERQQVRAAGPWLVFAEAASGPASGLPSGLGARLAERLRALGAEVSVVVPMGSPDDPAEPSPASRVFRIRPGVDADMAALLGDLAAEAGGLPRRILHTWSAADGREGGLETLLSLARGWGERGGSSPVDVTVITRGLRDVTGNESLDPAQALALGAVRSAPQEYPWLTFRTVDVPEGEAADLLLVEPLLVEPLLVDGLLRESTAARAGAADLEVALRGGHRWTLAYEPLELGGESSAGSPAAPLRQGGVYLITGGLGGLGAAIAESLARDHQASLVLLGRTPLPPRDRWPEKAREKGSPLARKIARIRDLEALGARVLPLVADVSDPAALAAARAQAIEAFGAIHGVIHAAGLAGGSLIATRQRPEADRVLAPKVEGARAIREVFAADELDFVVHFSSVTAVLSQLGQADYAAANAYLDADAYHQRQAGGGLPVISLAWDAWREVGMAVTTEVPEPLRAFRERSLRLGLSPSQGVAAFRLALAQGLPHLVITRTDFAKVREESLATRALDELAAAESAPRETHARPELGNAYVPPGSETERRIAELWQHLLGVDPVGLHDNFFELGGNSLVGLKVISGLKERFACEVPVVTLFEGPTVAAMARIVERQLISDDAEAPEDQVAFEERRSRGARRRELRRRRRS